MDVNLVRDKETGKSRGFGFLMYEDQRSTVLAVDNMNGTQVMGRTLKVSGDQVALWEERRLLTTYGDWILAGLGGPYKKL